MLDQKLTAEWTKDSRGAVSRARRASVRPRTTRRHLPEKPPEAPRVILADTAAGTCERLFVGLCMAGMEPSFCHDFGELLDSCQKEPPRAVFLTFAFMGPEWEHELAEMRSLYPALGIFVLAEQNPDCVAVVSAVQAGASGVFHCRSRIEDVVAAVQRTTQGMGARDGRSRLRALSGYADLTPRERETLELIFRGKTNIEAAEVLSISHRTVEVHRHRLMKKLGARNTTDLIRMILAA